MTNEKNEKRMFDDCSEEMEQLYLEYENVEMPHPICEIDKIEKMQDEADRRNYLSDYSPEEW